MTQLPPYVTPGQAADFLVEAGIAIGEDAVRRWCRIGKVPAITLPGGQYRIRREYIEAILAGQTTPAVDGPVMVLTDP